jgi:hypothetical protein
MGGKGGLIHIFGSDRYLPVADIAIQRGEDTRIPKGIDALIHEWQRIRIANRKGIKPTVIHEEP